MRSPHSIPYILIMEKFKNFFKNNLTILGVYGIVLTGMNKLFKYIKVLKDKLQVHILMWCIRLIAIINAMWDRRADYYKLELESTKIINRNMIQYFVYRA